MSGGGPPSVELGLLACVLVLALVSAVSVGAFDDCCHILRP
jgi:hypothetical protein